MTSRRGTARASIPTDQRLLVVAPAWIGDIILAQSLFAYLKQRDPDLQIDVLALDWCRDVVARMPEVNRVLRFPADHGELRLPSLRELGRSLRAEGYQQSIVLRNNIKSALVPWFARIRRRTGYVGEMRYGLLNDIRQVKARETTTRVQEYLALGVARGQEPPGCFPRPRLRVDADRGRELIASLGLATDKPVVAIAPGASYGTAKRWPPSHYAGLAKRLGAAGFAVWVFGGEDDTPAGAVIAAAAGPAGKNLCGRTSLADVIDLAATVSCMVGADSGLTHLAAAVALRAIGLYGPTSADYAPPLHPLARSISAGLACTPCGKRECPLGHAHCMSRIDVETVYQACVGPAAGNPASR